MSINGWMLFRLAYLWISHFIVISTMYRGQQALSRRMNIVAVLLTPLFFIRVLTLPSPISSALCTLDAGYNDIKELIKLIA